MILHGQPEDGAAEKEHRRREGNIFPDCDGKDGVVGNQRVEAMISSRTKGLILWERRVEIK